MVKGLLLQHNIIAFSMRKKWHIVYKRATNAMKGKVF